MSIELPNTAKPGLHGNIFRNAVAGPALSGPDGVQTLYESWRRSVTRYGNNPCAGYRPVSKEGVGAFVWETYNQVDEKSIQFAGGLAALKLCPPTKDFKNGLLGFYAKNRFEWTVGEAACLRQGIVAVPLYDTLGQESCQYVVDQTLLSTVACTSDVACNMISAAPKGSSLKNLVLMDGKKEAIAEHAKAHLAKGGSEIQVYNWNDIIEAGKKNPCAPQPPESRDVAFFCYTSGTTGNPKGALITHINMIANLAAVMSTKLSEVIRDDGSAVHLSYLPLPHVFERVIQMVMLAMGGRIGYYQGDTNKIMEDLVAVRPTFFPSVPRLLTRVHDKLVAGVNEAGGVKASLFRTALAAKIANLRVDEEGKGSLKHKVWDAVVFNPLKKRLGLDRVEMILTGSAPLSDSVMSFLRAVFGVPVVEGYGQTETAAVSTITSPEDFTTGHVGVPVASNEIALFDVPEMGYKSTDKKHGDIPCRGRGEICVRGPNVFREYYKLDDKTAETIDAEGWLHSGDIGIWTTAGKLKIVDRKKNIFKLSQGEYVAAEKIENVYVGSPYILMNFVYGDSLQSTLVGIVVPDEEQIRGWASKAENGVKDAGKGLSFKQLCEDAKVKAMVYEDMNRCAKVAGLKGFEMVKAIHLEHEPFSVERGLITPTFKLKRQEAREFYRAVIDQLYASQNAAPKAKL